MEDAQRRAAEARAERLVLAIGLEKREAAVLAYDAAMRNLHVLRFAEFADFEQMEVVAREPVLAVLGAHGPDTDRILVVCSAISARHAKTLVIVLCARHDAGFENAAVAAGADDVVACPDRLLHVLTRLHGLLARADRDARRDLLIAGRLVLHRKLRHVCLDNRRLDLTRSEFAIVEHLAEHRGRIVPISGLMDVLETHVTDGAIREHIRHIRSKMNPANRDDTPIRNEHGQGYLLDVGWEPQHEEEGGVQSDRDERASGVMAIAPLAKAPASAGPGVRRRA